MHWFRVEFDSKQTVVVEASDMDEAEQLVVESYCEYRGWDGDAIQIDVRPSACAQHYLRIRDELHHDHEPHCAIVQTNQAGIVLWEKHANQAGAGTIYENQLPEL